MEAVTNQPKRSEVSPKLLETFGFFFFFFDFNNVKDLEVFPRVRRRVLPSDEGGCLGGGGWLGGSGCLDGGGCLL